MKNAVKHIFDKGYETAILDKIVRFGSVSRGFILDLGEMVVCWGFYFVKGSSSRTHIQVTTQGPSGLRMLFKFVNAYLSLYYFATL